jgi:hypothetical protein
MLEKSKLVMLAGRIELEAAAVVLTPLDVTTVCPAGVVVELAGAAFEVTITCPFGVVATGVTGGTSPAVPTDGEASTGGPR